MASQALFRWNGIDKSGNEVSGETESDNEAMVKVSLRRRGIKPTRVKKKAGVFGIGGGRKKKKIKQKDIALFSRQLATILAAGVPMIDSLQIISEGVDNPSLSDLIRAIRDDIEAGDTLATALSNHPKHFDDLFVNLVAAGEESGALETLLDKIATYKEKTEQIKSKVRKALFYPAAVLVVAFAVIVIMLVFVVPQFESLFSSFGADLPGFTLMVIGMSKAMQQYWWMVIGGVVGTVYAFSKARKSSRRLQYLTDRALLKFPIIGEILYKAAVARFARTTSTMFAAGVPLVEALTSVAKTAGNLVFESAIRRMQDQVATGMQLQAAMANANLFPNMANQMVAIGEESGALDDMCAKVASFYEDEVDERVDALSSLLEPLIMVVIGVVVGGMVVAMYLPIFKLGSVV